LDWYSCSFTQLPPNEGMVLADDERDYTTARA
jgi:hypothetical protein